MSATSPAATWDLNPIQWDFVASQARFSFYVGGIGAGKTFAGAVRAICLAVEHPGSLGLIGAPTYPMLRDATARIFFALLPTSLIATQVKAEERLVLVNGSEILLRSMESPDRARGLSLAWFWLDEAPLCGYYAWQVLKGRLRQRGFATAGLATGTPHGRDGFARDFELARRPGHALYRASTLTNAHNLPPGFVEELGYTGAFARQEIEGQFVAFEGLVYPFEPGIHVREAPQGQRWQRVVGGVDWGYTNPAAGVVIGLDGDNRAWQLDEIYMRRAALHETLLPALAELTRRHGVSVWYCGPDEPEHIVALNALLAEEGLHARALAGHNAVRAGIQTVTALLAARGDGTRGLLVAPRCANTIAEFTQYAYAPTHDGATRDASEAPIKQHDHAMDALRYCLHTALGDTRATRAYLDRMR